MALESGGGVPSGGTPQTVGAATQGGQEVDATGAATIGENVKTMKDGMIAEVGKNQAATAKQSASGWR